MSKEIYISTDIEADGPIPGPYSMLSLGSAAFTIDCDRNFKIDLIDQFSVNLIELPGATRDPATMNFWEEHSEAWEENRRNVIDPKKAIKQYVKWLKCLPGNVVFIAWPATYDFTFVYWYLINFTKESPFKWSGLDMRSYYMAMTKQKSWIEADKVKLPIRYLKNNPLPHVAINDAIEQGWQFCYMYSDNLWQGIDLR